MSIILKILIGVLLLALLVAVMTLVACFIAFVADEWRWRKRLSDDYKMYSDARENEEN